MIVVDNKELNLSIPIGDPEFENLSYNEKLAIEKMDEISKLKSFKLVYTKKLDLYQIAKKATRGFDVSGAYVNPKTHRKEKWVYCNVNPLIKGTLKYYPIFHLPLNKVTENIFNPQSDAELIFFLTTIVNVSKAGFKIEDKAGDAKRSIGAVRNEVKVKHWILEKCSDDDILKLSLRWGISINDKTNDELRFELLAVIERNEKLTDTNKRGYSVFLKEVENSSDVIRIGSYFMNEVKKGTIVFNPTSRTCVWAGTNGEALCGVIPPQRYSHDKEEYVIQYLVSNPEAQKLFLDSITDEKTIELNDDYTLISHVKKLQAWAKKKTGETFPNSYKLDEGKAWIAEYLAKQEESLVEEY
jgi:hypothetical protein